MQAPSAAAGFPPWTLQGGDHVLGMNAAADGSGSVLGLDLRGVDTEALAPIPGTPYCLLVSIGRCCCVD